MEIVAILIDNVRNQIACYEKIEKLREGKKRGNEEEIGLVEREIAVLQSEIDHGRLLFRDPVATNTVVPPSPVLAVRTRAASESDEASRLVPFNLADELDSIPSDLKDMGKEVAPAAQQHDPVPTPVPVEIPANRADALAMTRFVMGAIPKHTTLRCTIRREKGSLWGADYALHVDKAPEPVLFASKKASLGSHYQIFLASDRNTPIGDLRAKLNSNIHKLVSLDPHTPPTDEASIYYRLDSKGEEGEYGVHMKVVIPALEVRDRPAERPADLQVAYEQKDLEKIHVLSNKRAVWIPSMQTHILQYASKNITNSAISSVKNFQLVHKLNVTHVLLEFGKLGNDSFELSFQNPLSLFQAFAATLVVF